MLANRLIGLARGGESYSGNILARSPSALYMMEETSGTQLTDASSNANHGSYVGGVLPTSPPLITEGARSLNATSSQYATAPGAVAPNLSGFSIVLWLRWTHADNLVVCERNGNNGYSIQSGSASSIGAGKIGCASWNGGEFEYLVSSIAINDDLPHCVIFVFGATAATSYIFIDGVDRTTRPGGNASPSYGASTVWHLGSRAGSLGFAGRMDGVAFIPSLLSAAAAAAINSAGRA